MSRSQKRSPFIIDHHVRTTKEQKKIANKKVRRNKFFDISGNSYRKIYPSYNICDFKWIWTKEEAIQEWYEEEKPHYHRYAWRHSNYKNLKDWLSYWAKTVNRK